MEPLERSSILSYLVAQAEELRSRASRVSEFTNIANVTPFLLPYENFQSRYHRDMVERLYNCLGVVDDISSIMESEKDAFTRHHPRVRPPKGQPSCYSDNRLFFKSPGRARHGYFRHTHGQGHHPSCLLAARCRFGGSYPHDLHLNTPSGRVQPRLYSYHDLLTVNEVFFRRDPLGDMVSAARIVQPLFGADVVNAAIVVAEPANDERRRVEGRRGTRHRRLRGHGDPRRGTTAGDGSQCANKGDGRASAHLSTASLDSPCDSICRSTIS